MMRSYALILIVSIVVLSNLSCKKAEEGPAPEIAPMSVERDTPAEMAKSLSDESGGAAQQETAEVQKQEGEQGLTGHFIAPMDMAKVRLLEYRIDLIYESDDISRSRQELLAIVGKYGYIKDGTASMEEQPPAVIVDVLVKADKIYEALQLFEKVGTLLEEKITVTDHTEAMMLQERTLKREQLRIIRKNQAAGQVAPIAKNWKDIENSLAQSEDRLDAADQEKWKIRDKVAWALVHVNLRGPDRIVVPNYLNAVVGMVNFILRLLWGIIFILPVLVIVGFIIWKRKQIGALFRRKK